MDMITILHTMTPSPKKIDPWTEISRGPMGQLEGEFNQDGYLREGAFPFGDPIRT